MEERICVECGKNRIYENVVVEGVPVSICCEPCCRRFRIGWKEKLYGGQHRVPRKWCKVIYGCSKKDLDGLNCLVLHYPFHQKKVQFYLGAEVEYLGKAGNHNGWKEVLKQRKAELNLIVGAVKLQKMDTVLRAFLLGDYLKCHRQPSTTLDDIKQRLAVLDRVKRILKKEISAHPGAVFDFCIKHPEGRRRDFREHKATIQRVFQSEGERIMRFLTKTDRDALMETPLRDVVDAFINRDKKLTIRSRLEQWMSREEALKTIKHPACQLRIEREDDESAIAEKLQLFWNYKDDKELRRFWLEHTAREHNLGQLTLSRPQRVYIEGHIDCDAEELVGLQELSQGPLRLLTNNHLTRTSMAVSRFEACLYYKGMSYEAAIAEAIQFGSRVPLPQFCGTRAFDYNVHATGFWSEIWNDR